jgi:hypothetical protein
MTRTLPRLATAMNESRDPRVLHTVALDGVAVAIWRRDPPAEWQAWLDGIPAAQLPHMRRILPAGEVRSATVAACNEAGIPLGLHRDRLLDNIATMAELAALVLASPLIEVRLDVTEGQLCPKWHIDTVRGRLLCTLRGCGTEFGPTGPDGRPSTIHAVPTGAAALFRGLLWPGRDLSGIVHRSPPANGETRLLIVVDPVDDAGSC